MGFYLDKHVVSAEHFDYNFLEELFKTADLIESMHKDPAGRWELRKVLRRRYDEYVWWDPDETQDDSEPFTALIHTIDAPSLRTAPGSWQAMRILGGDAIYYQASGISPFMAARARDGGVGAKKERLFSIAHTAHELKFDTLLLRSDNVKEEGTFRRLADSCEKAGIPISIVSMGEGNFEHPLQMLASLALIRELKGDKLRGGKLKIALIGDVESSRVFHSLPFGLAHYGATIYFVSPEGNVFPEHIWERVQRLNEEVVREKKPRDAVSTFSIADTGVLRGQSVHDPFEIIGDIDVCVFSRLQENLKHEKTRRDMQRLQKEFKRMHASPELRAAMPKETLVSHALPSGEEFDEELHFGVDKRFQHWREVEKGLYTKAAVFMYLMKPHYTLSLNYYWNKAKDEMRRRKNAWIGRAPRW